jgi:hypothetical protein
MMSRVQIRVKLSALLEWFDIHVSALDLRRICALSYSWRSVSNLFDRDYMQPAIYMSPMVAFDNKDTSNTNCQTAE